MSDPQSLRDVAKERVADYRLRRMDTSTSAVHDLMARLNQHAYEASARQRDAKLPDDVCIGCALPTSLHFDTSGTTWIGCFGAERRAAVYKPEILQTAMDRAVLSAGGELGMVLYPLEPGQPESEAVTFGDLSEQEQTAVVRMVEMAIIAYHAVLQHGNVQPVSADVKGVIEAARERGR